MYRSDQSEDTDLIITAMLVAIAVGLEIEEQERAADLRLYAMAGCTPREARAAMREMERGVN
jgi:hypothetical protein